MASDYTQKLKDPRWQRRRLQILERDNWTCQKCGDTETTLMVHHRLYRPDTDPWDYSEHELVTLCKDCHEQEYCTWAEADEVLCSAARLKLWADDAHGLGCCITSMKTKFSSEIIMRLVWWLLRDASAQELLNKAYTERFSSREADNGATIRQT